MPKAVFDQITDRVFTQYVGLNGHFVGGHKLAAEPETKKRKRTPAKSLKKSHKKKIPLKSPEKLEVLRWKLRA